MLPINNNIDNSVGLLLVIFYSFSSGVRYQYGSSRHSNDHKFRNCIILLTTAFFTITAFLNVQIGHLVTSQG